MNQREELARRLHRARCGDPGGFDTIPEAERQSWLRVADEALNPTTDPDFWEAPSSSAGSAEVEPREPASLPSEEGTVSPPALSPAETQSEVAPEVPAPSEEARSGEPPLAPS